MDQHAFRDLCLRASSFAIHDRDRIGKLILTQARGDEPTIREPEMLHAFCRTLDSSFQDALYGVEVPTKNPYRFVDEKEEGKRVKARHDLVLLNATTPMVIVELKTGQPAASASGDYHPAIRKDLIKLLLEECSGKAMFHVCHASKGRTLSVLKSKYDASLAKAMGDLEKSGRLIKNFDWFDLYILVQYNRKKGGRPYIHRYSLQSPGQGLPPVFQPNHTDGQPVPRD